MLEEDRLFRAIMNLADNALDVIARRRASGNRIHMDARPGLKRRPAATAGSVAGSRYGAGRA
jgi:CRISPR/Cas system-associated protein Csm6